MEYRFDDFINRQALEDYICALGPNYKHIVKDVVSRAEILFSILEKAGDKIARGEFGPMRTETVTGNMIYDFLEKGITDCVAKLRFIVADEDDLDRLEVEVGPIVSILELVYNHGSKEELNAALHILKD
jgi:hypothetical protein